MAPTRLFAKSWELRGNDYPLSVTLPGHLADVQRATGQVLTATGEDQLRALGLSPEQYLSRFRRVALVAAAVHDLGKANNHFQGIVGNDKDRGNRPQGLRHEWVSLLMLQQPALRAWLLPAVGGCERDWDIMLCSVAGHHPAYNRPSPPSPRLDVGAGSEIVTYMGHADFRESLEWMARVFSLEPPPPTETKTGLLSGSGSVFPEITGWFCFASQRWEEFTGEDKRFLSAVKSCLIAGDVAGSALPRVERDATKREAWIATAFANITPPGRVQAIVDRRRDGRPLYPFQEQIAASSAPVTFVRAGCGSGKTLAAYQWAARQHPTRRLYFCYPTTGTATEGFKDYLYSDEEEFDAELFHGRAEIDREIILGAVGDEETEYPDTLARIESLDAWATPIVACTVDTVLGLIQNNRRGLFAWPALAGAAFIFDEIHAYDDKLFGALLRFLEAVPGVPVLLMTASLPAARSRAIQQVMQGRDLKLPTLPLAPLESELWKRYQRLGPRDPGDPLPEVREELARGGKVLWVCNTVNRAIDAANRAKDFSPRVYHSRFRYEDRVQQHKEVVAAFDPKEPGPVLACCTQVAEISLDLKGVTLLVAEIAPVAALIQRLGRLNRQATASTPTRPFLVVKVEPEDHLPYTKEALETADRWLDTLGNGPLSQDDLTKCWSSFDTDEDFSRIESKWLDGGPSTLVETLREPSIGITVLLASDASAVRDGRVRIARVALPMPQPQGRWKATWKSWPRVNGLPVAPPDAIDYDKKRGAKWRK